MLNIVDPINGFLQEIESGGLGTTFLQSCLAAERELRQTFARNPEHVVIKSPYVGLIDIFDLPPQSRLARPRMENSDEEYVWEHGNKVHRFPSKHILSVKPYLRRTHGTPCTVEKLSDFLKALDEFSGGSISAIEDWNNLFLAGGAALAALELLFDGRSAKERFKIYQSRTYRNSDIDLFLWGLNEAQAKIKMHQIFQAINSSLPWDVVCFRTKNTITIQGEYPKRPIQIVMRLYRTPAEILCGFDVDCCCIGFNGINVFTNPRGLSAILQQRNTIDLSRRSPSYEHRLAKYSDRGYEIFYPALDRGRINYNWLASPNRSLFPKGLGRLIVYEIMRADYRYFPMLYDSSAPGPIPIQTLRPSNYDYAWCRIPYGPKWWDVQKVKQHVERVGELLAQNIPRDRRERAPIHRHVITCGTMVECLESCCDNYAAASAIPISERGRYARGEDLAGGLFRGPATFINDDPGRQLIGSFNPITQEDWELEAYIHDDDEDDSGDSDDSDEEMYAA